MLKIRLARGGAKKRPFYRIVVAEVTASRDGRFIERLGSYNPMLAKDDPNRVVINHDRVKYWLGVGAQPTDRIARFLGEAELAPMPKVPSNQTKQHLPKAKAQERLKEKEDAANAAAEAAKQAEEDAKAAAAAPAEAPAPEAEAAPEAPAEEAAAEEKPADEAASA